MLVIPAGLMVVLIAALIIRLGPRLVEESREDWQNDRAGCIKVLALYGLLFAYAATALTLVRL